MGPLDLVLAPLRAAQTAARAVEDLHDLAERARREPDPVEDVRKRLDELLAAVTALNATAETIVTGGRDLRLTGERLDAHTKKLIDGGSELTEVAEELEDSVETVADTVEPLQGLARGVGRLSRGRRP